jgi:SAM-dependent methyltransferase
MKKKNNIFDIVEGYYLAKLLVYLNRRGFFADPAKKRSIRGDSPDSHVLRFLMDRSDILIPDGANSVVMNPKYASYMELGFHIEKFLEAYGEFDLEGNEPLVKVDEGQFSQAFERASAFQDFGTVLKILSALKVRSILDLGCGAGNLIVQFCRESKSNTAIGIDQNAYLNGIASNKIAESDLQRRAKAIRGNVTEFYKLLSVSEIRSTQAIFGSSIFNEFFYRPADLIKFFKALKKYFPGRYLIVSDYYGSFNTPKANNKRLQHNYVHDVMQILTGQGLPPKDHQGWNEYYKKANCDLAYVYEGTDAGINWFIHIVRLGAK